MQLRSLLIRLYLAQGMTYGGCVRIIRAQRFTDKVISEALALADLAQLSVVARTKFLQDWDSSRLQKILDAHQHVAILTILDPDYPPQLMASYQPPLVLFISGQRSLLKAPRILAVVGSRQASSYAPNVLKQLLPALVTENVTIVSGLAAGVDSQAQALALQLGLPTIGVIGTGLDRVYPRGNDALQTHVSQVGLLISEYPLGTPPKRYHFPARNRIIAGLCQTLVVVEAREHSGSLITANLALQNDRNVLAVPGPIDAPLSVGCNQLIAAGAKPVLNSRHIIEEFLPII